MKNQFIFLLLVCLQIILANVCEKNGALTIYSCKEKLKDDKCLVQEDIENKHTIIHLRDICGKDEVCAGDTLGVCLKRELQKIEGEKCVVNPECYSNKCNEGKCEAVVDGGDCENDIGCKANSYCDGGKCKPLRKEDETCLYDSDCIFNYACGAKGKNEAKICVKLFSLKSGAFSSNPLLCETGFVYDSTDRSMLYSAEEDTSKELKCATSTSEVEKCNVDSDCKYKIDDAAVTLSEKTCACDGKGTQGYCKIGSSDPIFQDYLKLYKEEIDGMTLGDTDHVSYLRQNGWGIPKLIQARANIDKFQKFKDIDKCAIRYLTKSNWIHLSSVLLLFSIILF